MIEVSRYKHVVWDWNGTLINDSWLCVEVINGVLKRRGLATVTHEEYEEAFGFPVIDYYVRLGFDFEKESFDSIGREFIYEYERRRTECELQESAVEILTRLRDAGLTQSILSAYNEPRLHQMMDHFDLRDYFTHVIGRSDHNATGKVEEGLAWIKNLHVEAKDVLMVGDTVHDFEVAEAIGAACILIPGGNQPKRKLEACAVPVFDSLGDFLEHVPAAKAGS